MRPILGPRTERKACEDGKEGVREQALLRSRTDYIACQGRKYPVPTHTGCKRNVYLCNIFT